MLLQRHLKQHCFFDVVNEIQASFLSHLDDSSYRSQSVSPNMIDCIGEFQ